MEEDVLESLRKALIQTEEELNNKSLKNEKYSFDMIDGFPAIALFLAKKGDNFYFQLKATYSFSQWMSEKKMLDFIGYCNPKWKDDINKLWNRQKKSNPETRLYETIVLWLNNHPRNREKLIAPGSFNHREILSKLNENELFNMYRREGALQNRNWCKILLEYSSLRHLLFCTINELIDVYKSIHSVEGLSAFEQSTICFQEELGVHSLKEVESIESALCYLLYRFEWLHNNNMLLFDKNITELIAKKKKEFFPYLEKNPEKTIYEYLCDTGGFDGDLWTSYEEFLHDEWLDDDFCEKFFSTFHKDEKESYNFFRAAAFSRKEKLMHHEQDE